MSKENDYNKGVESGLKVAQGIMEQEVAAMDYLKSRIDLIVDGHDEMKMAVNHLVEDMDRNAISDIFGICNRMCPNELKDHEQKMLISIIATLSTGSINEDQRRFFNNLRKHMNVVGYEPDTKYDFRRIESLETVSAIKVIAKAVRIYLYLDELSIDGIYRHEDDLFSHFELRSYDEIDAAIETIFCIFGKEGLVEFYGDYETSDEEEEPGEIKKDGIIINLKRLKQLRAGEKTKCFVSIYTAQKFFSIISRSWASMKTYETNNHVVYKNDNKIYFFSKVTGETKEFNLRKVLIDNKNLSEATSDDVIERRICEVYENIKEFSDGFFFAIGPCIYYSDIGDDANKIDCIIDLSENWENGDAVKIKGIESDYFVFSYKGKEWCLLNIDTGEIIKPEVLINRSDKFIIDKDYVYYVVAKTSEYKANKGYQNGKKTDWVQVFQYNFVTGAGNPASKAIYRTTDQIDGLGLLEKFEKVGDKYVMLRMTHFASNSSTSFIGMALTKLRGSYLYMTFDSHFNPISGETFKSIDGENVYSAEYCEDGVVIYVNDSEDLKMISLITGKKKVIKASSGRYALNLLNCGNYHFANKEIVNSSAI